MREIKFRGKQLENGEWAYGYYVANTFTNPAKHYIYHSANQNFIWEVEPDTVGQYTGLKDKNGKEIYASESDFAALKAKLLGNTAEEWMGMYHIAADRALKAEAEVERLQTDMIDYRRGATYMTKKIQDLMAENIQLRNVESAAREVVWDCPTQADLDDDEYECDKECFNGTCPTCEIFRLQKVIAELDKESE